MTQVEYWRWRYRDPLTGQICRTSFACTGEEAGLLYGEAEAIEGTLSLIEKDLEHCDPEAAEVRTPPPVIKPQG